MRSSHPGETYGADPSQVIDYITVYRRQTRKNAYGRRGANLPRAVLATPLVRMVAIGHDTSVGICHTPTGSHIGWRGRATVEIIDEDLGRSGGGMARPGFRAARRCRQKRGVGLGARRQRGARPG